MSRGKRTRIALGIYRDRAGFAVVWQEGGAQREQRFAADTPLHRLKDFRRDQVHRAKDQPKADSRHGLARDVVRYLRTRKGRPNYSAARSHLRAWVHRFPRTSRWALTREAVQQTISDWQAEGKSAQTIRHRVNLLRAVYKLLDGSHVRTPVEDLTLPPIERARPRSVAQELVREVAARLQHREETDGRMGSRKTRARYLVLAATGQRPAQLRRAKPEDVDLERRLWFVRPAKGDRGGVVYLNDDMLAAWQLFIAEDAWGTFDGRSFVKTLQRNGWPKGVRPYTLRHTVGITLANTGADMADISAHLGHSSIDVTRAFYVPTQLSRLQAVSTHLDGRIHPSRQYEILSTPQGATEDADAATRCW